MPKNRHLLAGLTAPVRGFGRAVVFLLKVFPMIPARPVDWVAVAPVVERVKYPRRDGEAEGEVYRPSSAGPHPAVVVCLGVVPFEVDHPQVPVLGRALARAGFAALLYWSPDMREFRIVPEDIENLAMAYRWLSEQPYVDASRSGLMGTCVGGAFALMAASSPLVRDRLAFASAYAPFSSMETFVRDIASCTREENGRTQPWAVDQLTRKVFVHSLTHGLKSDEAERLRNAFAVEGGRMEPQGLSEDGRSVFALLDHPDGEQAVKALHSLPPEIQARLRELTLLNHIHNLRAPLVMLLHDVGDKVIPVGESRRLAAALGDRPGFSYTEMQFSHLDPTKGRLPLWKLLQQFGRFFRAVLPMFRQAVR